MHNECQNIFIVEAVSLILLDELTKTQQTTSTAVLITQMMVELKLFQPIQLIHFDDCIQCDHTVKELI